jgi:hypothetical protein
MRPLAFFPITVTACGGHAEPARDLDARARTYTALHARIAARLPPLATSPDRAAVTAREDALTAALVGSGELHPGLLFTDEIGTGLRRRLASLLQGENGRNVRGAILDANPAGSVAAGAPYPSAAPLSTVPTAVLEALPPLPDALEYRFVGRDLIVRDMEANLVVDVLQDAFT